jgi:hypothetical protein
VINANYSCRWTAARWLVAGLPHHARKSRLCGSVGGAIAPRDRSLGQMTDLRCRRLAVRGMPDRAISSAWPLDERQQGVEHAYGAVRAERSGAVKPTDESGVKASVGLGSAM